QRDRPGGVPEQRGGAGGRGQEHPRGQRIDPRRGRLLRRDQEEEVAMAEKTRRVSATRKAKATKGEPKAKKAADKPEPGSVAVVNADNKKVRDITLAPEVFGVKVNSHLLYEVVKQYRAGGRRGTHMTKNRALVSGGGKKPWPQKATGRPRAGEGGNPPSTHAGSAVDPY